MIEAFCDWADRRMEQGAAALDPEMRLHRRVRAVIALRLEQNRPHKEAIRRALALLALPVHARLAAVCTARTVDAIWHAAGDRSADFSWYTKRAILAAVYAATFCIGCAMSPMTMRPLSAFSIGGWPTWGGSAAFGAWRGQSLRGCDRPAPDGDAPAKLILLNSSLRGRRGALDGVWQIKTVLFGHCFSATIPRLI